MVSAFNLIFFCKLFSKNPGVYWRLLEKLSKMDRNKENLYISLGFYLVFKLLVFVAYNLASYPKSPEPRGPKLTPANNHGKSYFCSTTVDG